MSLEQRLTEGSVPRQLIRYALPLVTTSLLQAVYGIVDTIVAGRFIGSDALSGINNASLVMNLVTQIAIAFTLGGNVLISQLFGGGDEEGRKQASGTLVSVCILSGAAVSALLFLLARRILIALGAPSLEDAVAYLSVCALGTLFIFGYNALSAILRAIGNSKMPLYFIIISAFANIVLDLYFVIGLRWGVIGAALATTLSQIAAFLAALIFCLIKREKLGLTPVYLRPSFSMLKKISKLGFPLVLQWSVASISWLTVAFLINKYGVDCSAGNGISAKIKDLCQLFISALTGGASTMIAQNLGAKLYDRAYEVMKTCMKITLAAACLLIIFVQLTAPWLVSGFTNDPATHAWAVRNLRIEIFAQIFYAGFLTYNTLATSSGHTMFVMLNSFVNCIVVRMVLALVLERFFGADGIFLACAIAPLSSVPIGWWFARSERWKKPLAAA